MRSMRLAAPLLALLLCSCTVRMRQRHQPEAFKNASLGISVSLIAPIAILRLEPTVVYFAKIDEQNGLLQPRVIASDYSRGGLFYALDVPPGTYAAVGAQIGKANDAAFTVYFSTGLMARTITTVGDRELAFMGDFWVYMIPGLLGFDEAREHYARLITRPQAKPSLLKTLLGGDYYRGILMNYWNDEAKRAAFFRFTKEDASRREASDPGVRVAERLFWTGAEGNLGLEIKARFKSQAVLEGVLRPDMFVGSFRDKKSAAGERDWTLREILVSVNLNAAETAAVWRVSGPRPLIEVYAKALAYAPKKYPIFQDIDIREVRFRATAE